MDVVNWIKNLIKIWNDTIIFVAQTPFDLIADAYSILGILVVQLRDSRIVPGAEQYLQEVAPREERERWKHEKNVSGKSATFFLSHHF